MFNFSAHNLLIPGLPVAIVSVSHFDVKGKCNENGNEFKHRNEAKEEEERISFDSFRAQENEKRDFHASFTAWKHEHEEEGKFKGKKIL